LAPRKWKAGFRPSLGGKSAPSNGRPSAAQGVTAGRLVAPHRGGALPLPVTTRT
jgi:hypothetical protein